MAADKVIEGDESSLFMCKRCGIGTRQGRIYWRQRFPSGCLAREKWIEGWICNECGMRVRVRRVEQPSPADTAKGQGGDR